MNSIDIIGAVTGLGSKPTPVLQPLSIPSSSLTISPTPLGTVVPKMSIFQTPVTTIAQPPVTTVVQTPVTSIASIPVSTVVPTLVRSDLQYSSISTTCIPVDVMHNINSGTLRVLDPVYIAPSILSSSMVSSEVDDGDTTEQSSRCIIT